MANSKVTDQYRRFQKVVPPLGIYIYKHFPMDFVFKVGETLLLNHQLP